MFCGNCGTPVGDTAKFCPKCGHPIACPEESATNVEVSQNDEYSERLAPEAEGHSGQTGPQIEVYDGNPWQTDVPEKSGIVKKSILLGVSLAAVIILVAAAVMNVSALGNLAHKTFASPEKYYQYVEANAMSDSISSIASIYETDLRNNLETGNRSVSLDASLELSSEALTYLGTYTGEDLSWLQSVSASLDANSSGNQSSSSASLALGSDQLLSCNCITDLDNQVIYLQVPELSESYAQINLEDYLGTGYDTDAMEDVIGMLSTLYDRSPDKKTVEKILNRYVNAMVACIDDVEKGKGTLSAGGVSQKYTTLEVTIDGDTLYDVAEAVLEEMLEDEDLEDIILNFAALAEVEGIEPQVVYDEFIDALESTLDELEELEDYDIEIIMTLWVDSNGDIRGREIEVETMNLLYAMPKDGKDFGLEISADNGYETYAMIGRGTIQGDKLSGSFTISQGDSYSTSDLLELDVTDFDTEKWKEGYLNGTATFQPSSALSSNNALLSLFSVTVSMATEASSADCTIAVNSGSAQFATLNLSGQTDKNSGSVQIPDNVMPLETWVGTLDLSSFLTSLYQTDIPSDLIQDIFWELS